GDGFNLSSDILPAPDAAADDSEDLDDLNDESFHSSDSEHEACRMDRMRKKLHVTKENLVFSAAAKERPPMGIAFNFSMKLCYNMMSSLRDTIPPALFVWCKGVLIGTSAQMSFFGSVTAGTCYAFTRLDNGSWSWPAQYGVVGAGAYFGMC
ncbi:hypothetical protein SARC_14176, partial [Sphaeroforma arctica JP610]